MTDAALLEAVARRLHGDLRTPTMLRAGVEQVRPMVEAVLDELGETEVVDFGVARKDTGHVEFAGTKPGGDVGRFTEDEARYIAGSTGRLRRRVRWVYPDRVSEWEPSE